MDSNKAEFQTTFSSDKPGYKKKLVPKSFVKSLSTSVVVVILLFLGSHFVLQNYLVSGAAMEPALHDQQTIWVNKLAYLFSKPQRGDVIVISQVSPTDNICDLPLPLKIFPLIARVVGIPGDTVTNTDTSFSVNGKHLYTTASGENFAPASSMKLGINHYFVLGDNQSVSIDSRCLGPIPFDAIIGRVL